MAVLTETQRVDLADGRRVHVQTYDDGSMRLRITGTPYGIEEAFLKPTKGPALLKLIPLARREAS
jgi:hypothetical protein